VRPALKLVLKGAMYVAGMYIACSLHDWLFGTLLGVVCLLTVIQETKLYSKYLVYTSTVYLLAIFNSVHVLEAIYILALYITMIENISFTEELIPYVISITCLILFQFKTVPAGMITLALYILYLVKKYDPRILVGCAIILLTFSAYQLAVSNTKIANDVAVYSYYFLVFGVIAELIQEFRCKDGSCDPVDQSTEN